MVTDKIGFRASKIYERKMVRCTVAECRRWWTIAPDNPNPTCACGGDVEVVDMKAHIAALPVGKP